MTSIASRNDGFYPPHSLQLQEPKRLC